MARAACGSDRLKCLQKLSQTGRSVLNTAVMKMAKGTKLDLNIGGSWENGWSFDDGSSPKEMTILEPSKHSLVFQKEKRKGKPVTLVGPFSITEKEAQTLLSLLKKKLACGGAYKEGWMEFQGDIAPKIRDWIEKEGFCFKKPKL